MSDGNPEASSNPFAAPLTDENVEAVPTDVEAIRNQYLSHEASIKSFGVLYLVGAALVIPLAFFLTVAGFRMEAQHELATTLMIAFGVLVLGAIQLLTGLGLRGLKPWSRMVATVLATIGLLNVGIGTVISAYFLFLLLSKKGKMVFSSEYRAVIDQTPHIRYKTSKVVVALFVLVLIALVLAIVAVLFDNYRPV